MKSETKKHKSRIRNGLWATFFIGPHSVLFISFFLFPVVYGIYASFTKWSLFNDPIWTGLANYRELLFDKNSIFHDQLVNGLSATLIFVVFTVPLCIIVPLILAAMLQTQQKFKKLFQAVFYIPSMFAVSAVMLIFAFLLSRSYGPFTEWFNFDLNVTQTQPYAWLALILVTVWWCIGQNLIIYIAALGGVSQEEIDAARIDGASNFRILRQIQLPSIQLPMLFTVITTTVLQFNVYGQPLMLTNGGPNDSTKVLLMSIQQNAFGSGVPVAGMASAMATILGLVIILVSAVELIILKLCQR